MGGSDGKEGGTVLAPGGTSIDGKVLHFCLWREQSRFVNLKSDSQPRSQQDNK